MHEETVAEKTLPWQNNADTSTTPNSIPNNEPVIAHVPTWVNNLSYNHITETGSPYVSPQSTLNPQASDYHKTVYSIFPPTVEKQDANEACDQNGVNSSDYFPTPWGNTNLEDCPQVSPMVIESGARSDDLLHSAHTEQAPDHHHVIIPTHDLIDSSNSSEKHARLLAVASAPDFQHWKPLSKDFVGDREKHESDTMLSEMAFAEGVKSRVQLWLKQADSDDANDADEEDANAMDNLDTAENLEHELDLVMNNKRT